jgi:hypothetical protein
MIKKAQGGAKRVDHGMKTVQYVSDNRTNQLNSTLARGFAVSTAVSIPSLLVTISSRSVSIEMKFVFQVIKVKLKPRKEASK